MIFGPAVKACFLHNMTEDLKSPYDVIVLSLSLMFIMMNHTENVQWQIFKISEKYKFEVLSL